MRQSDIQEEMKDLSPDHQLPSTNMQTAFQPLSTGYSKIETMEENSQVPNGYTAISNFRA